MSLSSVSFIVLGSVLLIYALCLVVYRLLLSPIADFPGSKLTATTGWYETYLDVFKGGQFTLQIQKWHEQYGQHFRTSIYQIEL